MRTLFIIVEEEEPQFTKRLDKLAKNSKDMKIEYVEFANSHNKYNKALVKITVEEG